MKRKFLLIAAVILTVTFIPTGCTKEESPKAEQSFQQELEGTVTLENVEITVNETSIQKQLLPPDPSGYYNYYQEYEGYQYYAVNVTVKNNGEDVFYSERCLVTADMPDGSTAEGKLVLFSNTDSDFREGIDPGVETGGYLFILSKEEAGTPESIHIYYNHDFLGKDEEQPYDMETVLHVSS